MIDINFIRENPEKVKEGIAAKNANPKLVDDFLVIDGEWRKIVKEIDDIRAHHKELSEKRSAEEAKKVKVKIQNLEKDLSRLEDKRQEILHKIPNLPLPEVPVGKNESENIELRKWGEIPKFGFEPKDHLELGEKLDILDFETGSKVSGSGFYYLKNEGVLLELALVRYALDFLSKRGFTLYLTPDLARERFYSGTGYFPHGPEAHIYEIKDFDLGLIGTSEVTLAGIHADEVIAGDSLPFRYAGYSHCFRQEAGSYGKYSKGLYRVHQFSKVEMFAYAKIEESKSIHEEFLKLEEELWQGLKIPYRVIEMCSGDLGSQAARKFDLEAWMPGRPAQLGEPRTGRAGQGDWGEITSTSNTTDYQARNLGIRYRDKSGKIDFVHTLNGTAIATSRGIVAILENYQTKEGTVKIPEVLMAYLGFDEIK